MPAPVIGVGVTIASLCVVENGARIGDRVTIDHYCRVGAGSMIGDDTRLLYGAQIFDDVSIGERCIVGGPVDDRTVIEDDVTYMGLMAHGYRSAGSAEDWDTMIQPSNVIRRGAVIGVGAVLIGGIEIGHGAYVAAGEVVRTDVSADTVVLRGHHIPITDFRGLIHARSC
jgi:acetyltransferase-like isoleucine patch superfamily enzyme